MEDKIVEIIKQIRALQEEAVVLYGPDLHGHHDDQSPTWHMERGVESLEDAVIFARSVEQVGRIVDNNFTRTDLLEVAVEHGFITPEQKESGAEIFSDSFLREQILAEF